ncbi:hypothetical protein [Fusobacterium sp. SYSU M8D902]|uniref:toxin-antitoxin system YwqK family antitoxin n=1 Tax=Fusobacterium sp. SYSU M8D902 TaxID=3159562 RepID=UPI0032E4CD3B
MLKEKKEYFENGKLKAKWYENENGFKSGVTAEYYDNGIIKEHSYYGKNGKKDGMFLRYNKNGQYIKQGIYRDGIENGDFNLYLTEKGGIIRGRYENGKLTGELIFENSKEEILWKSHYKNGKKMYHSEYENGNLKEIISYFPYNKKEYYQDGEILSETFDKNNFRLSKGFIDNEVVSFSIAKNKECDFHLFCLKDGKLNEVIQGIDKISYKGNEALDKYKSISKLIGEDILNLIPKERIKEKATRGRATRGRKNSGNEK